MARADHMCGNVIGRRVRAVIIILLEGSLALHFCVADSPQKLTSLTCEETSTCSGNTFVFSYSHSCQCDDQCYKFGDCCEDSQHFKPSQIADCIEAGNWNIPGTGSVESYYMVKTCPSSWIDRDTINKCENYLENIKEEPILGHPITSKATNITYVNYHCARCNNDLHISTMIRWKLDVTCSKHAEVPFPDIDTVLSVSKIVNGKWIKPTFNVTHHTCKLYIWRPWNLLRKCVKDLINFCPVSWTNNTVREICETRTSFVSSLKGKAYRNVDCARCNGVEERLISCNIDNIINRSIFLPYVISNHSKTTNTSTICSNKNESYDPVIGKCRNVIWSIANGGKHFRNNGILNRNMQMLNTCIKATLEQSKFVINDDFSITDSAGKVYRSGQLRIDEEGHLEICSETSAGLKSAFVSFFGVGISLSAMMYLVFSF